MIAPHRGIVQRQAGMIAPQAGNVQPQAGNILYRCKTVLYWKVKLGSAVPMLCIAMHPGDTQAEPGHQPGNPQVFWQSG